MKDDAGRILYFPATDSILQMDDFPEGGGGPKQSIVFQRR